MLTKYFISKLFERDQDMETRGERGKGKQESLSSESLQMLGTARVDSGQSQEPGILPGMLTSA